MFRARLAGAAITHRTNVLADMLLLRASVMKLHEPSMPF